MENDWKIVNLLIGVPSPSWLPCLMHSNAHSHLIASLFPLPRPTTLARFA
jgi:hypothetical protein